MHVMAMQMSNLLLGNLSSEKVTKRDIFHVFHTYGDLAQISIKQAYGFVQFLRTEDCVRALDREQGTQIRDKKIRRFSRAQHIGCRQADTIPQISKSASRRRIAIKTTHSEDHDLRKTMAEEDLVGT